MTLHTTNMRVSAKRTPTLLQLSGAVLTVGSSVMTSLGSKATEDLKPGELIVTKDLGLQKLRYVAFQDINLTALPEMAPVKVNNANLGVEQGSYFAPDAHISIRHPMFDMMFGNSEVLIRCGDAVSHPGFEAVENLSSVTYIALGFARRHIVSCSGASVDIGPENRKTSRVSLGPEEARLALQLLEPRQVQAKRHSFPLH